MSLLASLVFVIAAIAAVGTLRMTIAQYAPAAYANVASLGTTGSAREFRFRAVTILARPTVGGEVVRIGVRNNAPRVIKSSARLRAAA